MVADRQRRAYVETPRRILGDHQHGIIAELTSENELLLVAAGESLHPGRGAGGTNVESTHQGGDRNLHRIPSHPPGPGARISNREVLEEAERENDRVAMPVFGHERRLTPR